MGCFKHLGTGVGAESTPKIHCLVTIHHPAKFSGSSCNGWNIEIVGMKNFRTLGSHTLGSRGCLTLKNLPQVVNVLVC